MSFLLSNFLGGATSTTGDSSYSDENKQLIVEKLTTKMTNSAHLEDRKAAAQTIKSLARSHRLEIGTLALQALIDELRRDLEDEELAKIVLETLDILCSSSINENEEKSEKSSGIEVQFCEILLKDEGNVALLLDLMGNSDDFYLRFTSIQILISLCNSQPFQLQSAVLNSPSGVEKVLNLLKDSREIVRNEGLLLCGVLVRGNSDLQKILAFQGAFEEVMQIIVEEEGPWTGPLIIQDAFNLISAMLNLNTSNQTYFRDSICFKQLAGLLALPQGEDAGLWNSTRISNYLAALNILDGILCKENVDLEASQNAAMRTHFQGPLLNLAFTPKIPLQVSASALNCLSGLIWSNNRAQQEFANEKLNQLPATNCLMKIEMPISPLMAAIILAVNGQATQEGVEQRTKALELVEAFCSGNSEGQLVLLSTLKASGTASPGTIILDALFDLDSSRKRDPWHCWYASILLCHLIDGNEEAKKVLLKHRIVDPEIAEEDEGEELLTSLMLNMIRIATDSRGSTCQKSIIGYLQLLVVWFHGSPSAIKAFLSESSFLQYLLERITQQPQELEIQGFAALIFGICVLFNDETVERVGSEALKGIIKNRIGPDLFVSRLSRLKSHSDKNDLICELSKGILLKNYESLMNLVVRPTPSGTKASHTATLAQLSKDLVESRALLASCQAHLSETSALADKLKIGIAERDAYILQLQKLISEKNQKIAQMAHEMSSHYDQQQQMVQGDAYEKCLADQAALKSLNETIKTFQETVARQQARIEELEALLRETEEKDSELEKWKEAYHKLYEQVQEQLNFVDNSAADFEGESIETDTNLNIDSDNTTNYAYDSLNNQNSENIEVLSPSMFMSPLTGSEIVLSEPLIVETTSNENSLSPELVTLNQIPLPDSMKEYPVLSEDLDTSFTAAVIVSEEFANNEPNPSADEAIQNISSECPPDNFLASDPDENVEIVSSEEIKNVLKFFDDLPEESASTSVSVEEESVVEVQEELGQMNLNDEIRSVDQQVPDVITEEKVNDSFELPEEMNEDRDEFDYYAESNFDYIPNHEGNIDYESYEEQESHLGYAVNNTTDIGEYDYAAGEDNRQKEEQAELPEAEVQEYSYDQTQDYSYDQSQDQFNAEETVHNEDNEQILHEQENTESMLKEREYSEELVQPQYPEDQFTQELRYTEDQTTQDQQYTEESYDYGRQEEQAAGETYSYDQQQEYTTEEPFSYDQQQQDATKESYNYDQQQDYTASDSYDYSQQDYTATDSYNYDQQQDYTASDSYSYDQQQYTTAQEVSGDQVQEPVASIDDYFSQEASQEFLQEYNGDQYAEGQAYFEGQEYNTGADEEYNQEQSEAYNQDYYATDNNGGYTQEYATQPDQVQNTEEYVQGQDANYSTQEYSYSQEYNTEGQYYEEYATEEQNYGDQEYNNSDYNQTHEYTADQTQEFSNNNYDQTAQEYNYYQTAQEYAQDTHASGNGQEYSASVYSTTETNYSQSTEHAAQVYAETADYANDNTQEQYLDYTQQDQTTESNEYYYYDEATGYTYGFDQNVNQYYYYDPNTGEYVYYTAPETTEATDNLTPSAAAVDESVASSNPSLFETTGPPMVSLQQSTPHVESQLHQSFVADPVYNL